MSPPIEITREEYIAAAINSIKKLFPDIRQDSKEPTFALQYGGTFNTLMRNCGFPIKESKTIVHNYKTKYAVSEKWTSDRIKEAADCGYVTAAFGLRIRTPLLAKTILDSRNAPYEAKAEARTAGNGLGQSWCLLNNRAANEFMERVWAHKDYRLKIRPVAQIHDALYFLIEDDTQVVKWVNDNLIECMRWQDHPLLEHPTVKIGANLDVFYKTWAQPIEIPNGASLELIRKTCSHGAHDYDHPK